LRNPSKDPHYFTSHGFTQLIYTRRIQVGVYPGQIAEWWFVPVAAGRVTDLRCGIVGSDGKSHAEHGMTGEIVIE